MKPRAIIDTSVLISLYHLDLLRHLSAIYDQVKVPREVEKEFVRTLKASPEEQSKRFDYISKFYFENKTWFLPCNEYETDIVQLFLSNKRIDLGEAEVFAQNSVFQNSHQLLLDEKQGRKLATSIQADYHGALYIIAKLDVSMGVCNYHDAIKKLKKANIGRYSDTIINSVFTKVKGEF